MRAITLPLRLRGVIAIALLLAAAAPARAQLQPAAIGPYFLGVQYGTAVAGDPLYDETTFDLFYPKGGYPHIYGITTPVMPLAIIVHGGNTNEPLSGPQELSPLASSLLAKGFVVVLPSYHVLDLQGEPYVNATKDVGRVVQFMRHYANIVNIRPDRVFCQGHSAGGFHSLYIGLNADFQDLASPDPVLHESSRPDFIAPWGAPADWTCYDFVNSQNPFMALLVFGVANPTQLTKQQKLDQSPTYWLAHPELYNRTTTPPMCLDYNLSMQSPCGAITDPHDGKFGVLLKQNIDRVCLQSAAGQPVCSQSILADSGSPTAEQTLADWMAAHAP
jgi:acetyl esterase/lipase